MSGIKWLYQNNLGKTSDEEAIKSSCNKYGYEFKGIKVIPFSDEVPNIEENKTTIYYGSTGWINKIYEKYNPSEIFFNPESVFTFWVNKYGKISRKYFRNKNEKNGILEMGKVKNVKNKKYT